MSPLSFLDRNGTGPKQYAKNLMVAYDNSSG